MTHLFLQLSNNFRAIILAIIGFSAFSVSDASSKWLTIHYPPLQVTGIVAIFSILWVLALAVFTGGLGRSFRSPNLRVHLARGVLNAAITLLIITSFSRLPIAQVYTLIFSAPFITTLMAMVFFKERVSGKGWAAIAFGFVGVLIVLHPGLYADFDLWLLIPLASSILIAALFLLARAVTLDDPLISLPLFPTGVNALLVGMPALTLFGLPQAGHLPFFLLSGFMAAAGLTCTAYAFRAARTALISPFMYLQMIWAVILGYLIFEDIPGPWTLLGAGIIIGSGIYLVLHERSNVRTVKIT